mgnify:CR=1 FL=1
MIHKRGDISVRNIIYVVIAGFVLVIVFSSFSGLFGKEINLLKWLPDFGENEVDIEDIVFLRYDLVDVKVEYYDGNDWVELKNSESVKLGGDEFNGKNVKDDFEEFYYERDNIGEIIEVGRSLGFLLGVSKIQNDHSLELTEEYKGVNTDFVDVRIVDFFSPGSSSEKEGNNGDVRAHVIRRGAREGSDGTVIYFLLRNNNDLEMQYLVDSEEGFVEKVLSFNEFSILFQLSKGMIDWRDSVFEKPIFIGGKVYFCAEFKDNGYIRVNLDGKEKSKGDKCGEI